MVEKTDFILHISKQFFQNKQCSGVEAPSFFVPIFSASRPSLLESNDFPTQRSRPIKSRHAPDLPQGGLSISKSIVNKRQR